MHNRAEGGDAEGRDWWTRVRSDDTRSGSDDYTAVASSNGDIQCLRIPIRVEVVRRPRTNIRDPEPIPIAEQSGEEKPENGDRE